MADNVRVPRREGRVVRSDLSRWSVPAADSRPPESALARARDRDRTARFNPVPSDGGVPVRRASRCPPGHLVSAGYPSGSRRRRRLQARTRRATCRSRRALPRSLREHASEGHDAKVPVRRGRANGSKDTVASELTGRSSTCEPGRTRVYPGCTPLRGCARCGEHPAGHATRAERPADAESIGVPWHVPASAWHPATDVPAGRPRNRREVSRDHIAGSARTGAGPVAALGGCGSARRGVRAGQPRSRHASDTAAVSSSTASLAQGLPSAARSEPVPLAASRCIEVASVITTASCSGERPHLL